MSMVIGVRAKAGQVRVNNTAIQGMFLETGQVGRHAKSVGRNIKREAEFSAPVRSADARLARSHTGPWYSKSHLGGHCTVGNDAPYALFVHEGTHGPIFPRAHDDLWIRPAPHSWFAYDPQWAEYGGRTPLRSVRGQSANPWIAKAMQMIVRITYLR